MPLLLQYLFKLSLTLAVFYLFYYAVLKNLTFYTWNRFYLLGYSLVAWVIPFINITPWLKQPALNDDHLLYKIVLSGKLSQITATENRSLLPFSVWTVIGTLLIVGSAVMIVRFLLQLVSIHTIKRSATLIQSNEINLYDVESPISPFSFAQSIFINARLHSEADLQKIIEHEFVHVRQRHTVDIMISELLCIVNWYNPFAWLIKKAIRENLEFIADNGVLQTGVDARDYQYLLLKVTGLHPYSISNNFTISSLKKRIAMMNRIRSAKVHLVRFLFVLPLLAVMLLAFRSRQENKKTQNLQEIRRSLMASHDTVPPPPPPPVPPVGSNSGKELAFPPPPPPPPLPKGVGSIQFNNQAVVRLKNGKKEVYDLDVPEQKEAYEKKYGKLPVPPPPPPPLHVQVTRKMNIEYTVDNTIVDTVAPVTYILNDVKVTEKSMQNFYNHKADSLHTIIYQSNHDSVNIKARNEVIGIATVSGDGTIQPYKYEGGQKKNLFDRFTGVLIVDGKKMPHDELNSIDPNSMESIDIINGNHADRLLYGEEAKEGVIIIKTKKTFKLKKNEPVIQ